MQRRPQAQLDAAENTIKQAEQAKEWLEATSKEMQQSADG
jgi:hypothetical protein